MSWIKEILADRMNCLIELAETIANETDKETQDLWYNSGGYTKEDTEETLFDIVMDEDEFKTIMDIGVSLVRTYNEKNKNNI